MSGIIGYEDYPPSVEVRRNQPVRRDLLRAQIYPSTTSTHLDQLSHQNVGVASGNVTRSRADATPCGGA
jgi:hypothetical protein